MTDPGLCDPQADIAAGRLTGSGINPDLEEQVTCDPEIALCVLKEPPEALRQGRSSARHPDDRRASYLQRQHRVTQVDPWSRDNG
ncbi:hypothetical protein [Sorangium sp. So ce590]|uniref:hypothetical protein n=2 Tax=Sorangium TaxID=39643 RepID=UPI003F608DC8